MGIVTEEAVKKETPAAVDPFASSALDISGLTLSELQVSALPDCCIPGNQEVASQGQESRKENVKSPVITVEVTDKAIEFDALPGNLPEVGFSDPFAASSLIIDGNSDLTSAIAAVPDCCKNPLDLNPTSNPSDLNRSELQKVEVQVSDKPIEQTIQNHVDINTVVGDPFSQAALNIDSSINIAEIAAVPDCCKSPITNNNPAEVNQASAPKVEVQISDKPIENSKEHQTQVNLASNDPFATAALSIDGVSGMPEISALPDCCKVPKSEATNSNIDRQQDPIQVELSDKPIDINSSQSSTSNQQSEKSIQKNEDSLSQGINKDREFIRETTKADIEHLVAKNAQDLTIISRVITSNNSQDLANSAVERLLVASLEQNAQIHSQDSSSTHTNADFRLTRIIAHQLADTPEVLNKPEIIVRELQDLVRAMNESRMSRNAENEAYNRMKKVEQVVVSDSRVKYLREDPTSDKRNKAANKNTASKNQTSGLMTRSTARNINQRQVSGAKVQQVRLNNNGKGVILATKGEKSLSVKPRTLRKYRLRRSATTVKSVQNQQKVNSSTAIKNNQKTKLKITTSTRLDKRAVKLKTPSTPLRLQTFKRSIKLLRGSRLNGISTKTKKLKLASTRQPRNVKVQNVIIKKRLNISKARADRRLQKRNVKIYVKDNRIKKRLSSKLVKLSRNSFSTKIGKVTKLRGGAKKLAGNLTKLIREKFKLVNLTKNKIFKKLNIILNKKNYVKILNQTKFVKQIKNLYYRVKASLYKSIKPKLLVYSNKITNNIYFKNLINILARLLRFVREFLKLNNLQTSFEQFLISLRIKKRMRRAFEDEFATEQVIRVDERKLKKCNFENLKYEQNVLLDPTNMAAKHIALTMFVLMYKEKLLVKQGSGIHN